jgi:pyruvate dehydrogenase E2 component (dihydrolipoamide acetyltransferase)
MPFEVKLPDIGEGIAEGEIVRWLVKVGDAVKDDQPLVEVMTDKASVEIPSPRTGTIAAIHAEAGSIVPVGSVIVSIAVAGESGAATAAAGAGAHGAKPVAAGAAGGGAPARGAPGGGAPASSSATAAAPARVQATPAASPPAISADEERIPLRGLRRRIAEAMRKSIDTAAHYTFVAECDFTALAAHRASVKAEAEAAGVKLTYLAYIVKALGGTLAEFPLLNARLDDERQEIVLLKHHHIGIATATEEGLTVPVIQDPEEKPLFAIARDIERLARAAREHTIRLEELQGGTFTVTSTGAKGGVLATPILHHPQVAILGVHEVKRKPAVVNDAIVIRDLGNLSLSLDHRVVDGAAGADFLYALISKLEHPERWIGAGDLA